MPDNWIEIQLPSRQQLGRFILWGSGRLLFSVSIFGLDAISYTLATCNTVVKWMRLSVCHLVKVYDQLPYMGTVAPNIIDATPIAAIEPGEVITDLTRALDGKHCLIIGDTGTGKSMIAQWLAYQVGGDVTVYDPDAAPEEWSGLKVIGRRGDFGAIAAGMADDLKELQRRIEQRGEHGDKALAGLDSVLIAEEFPLLKDEVEIATDWLIKHARRGRKPKRFVIALAQDDNVKTLGIEGEGGVRKCFRMLRLGKFAVTHAKSLKDSSLVEWLKSGKYRAMLDDVPCQLPDLNSFKMVIPRLQPSPVLTSVVTPETTAPSDFSPPQPQEFAPSDSLIRAVKLSIQLGASDSRIIKEVLGFQGSQYQQGKELLAKLKAEHGF